VKNPFGKKRYGENDQMTDPALDTLLWEYREIRQELREHMSAIDKNINTAFTVLGIIVSIGVGFHDMRALYLIPSFVFIFLMNHMTKSITLGALGAYCFTIETKLRNKFQPGEIVMDWEGGSLGFKTRDPFSLFGFGIFLTFLPVAGGFIVLSIMCYHFWKPSLAIHIAEAVLLIAYACGCSRWYRITYRKSIAAGYQESAEPVNSANPKERAAD
jgi:hypothetical protein